MNGSRELSWTPPEVATLAKEAKVIAGLRAKVENGSADKEESERFAAAVFALDRAVKDKETPAEFVELRRTMDAFYRSHNLPELADALPTTIRLSPEQRDMIEARKKEGYTRMMIIPAGIDQHLAKLKTNLTDGLGKDDQGKPIETYLSDNFKSGFPNSIQSTPPRPEAYLLLTNPDQSLLPGSKNKSADELIQELKAAGLNGLTLADFLIEERMHFDGTGKHLIDGSREWTWLLDSRDSASRVLGAGWHPGDRRVNVDSGSPGSRGPNLGVRPSIVLKLGP